VKREWLDRRFDDALLAIAMEAGFLYARRRARRVLRKLATRTAVVTGVGVATVAVTAGVGAVGAACGAVAWFRSRAKRSAAMARASALAGESGTAPGPPSATSAGSNSSGPSDKDPAFESSVGR
jgi:hypothetical protein